MEFLTIIEWPPHLVCFVDILGFDYLSRKCPEVAEQIAERFRTNVRNCINSRFDSVSMKTLGFGIEPTEPEFSGISDSIFITLGLRQEGTPMNPEASLLVKGLSDSLHACLVDSIPVRGSIAIGPAKSRSTQGYSGRLLVGRPVAQAAVFEQKQQWLGISMVPDMTATSEPVTRIVIKELKKEGLILRFGTPTDSGIQDCYVVTWPKELIKDSITRIMNEYQRFSNKPKVAAKYLTTLLFLYHQIRNKGIEELYEQLGKKGLISREE